MIASRFLLSFALAAGFALGFAFLGSPPAHATTITIQQCTDEYADSDAADSCYGGAALDIGVTSDGECSVTDTCPRNDGITSNQSNYEGPLAELDDLVNCDGTLTLNSC